MMPLVLQRPSTRNTLTNTRTHSLTPASSSDVEGRLNPRLHLLHITAVDPWSVRRGP